MFGISCVRGAHQLEKVGRALAQWQVNNYLSWTCTLQNLSRLGLQFYHNCHNIKIHLMVSGLITCLDTEKTIHQGSLPRYQRVKDRVYTTTLRTTVNSWWVLLIGVADQLAAVMRFVVKWSITELPAQRPPLEWSGGGGVASIKRSVMENIWDLLPHTKGARNAAHCSARRHSPSQESANSSDPSAPCHLTLQNSFSFSLSPHTPSPRSTCLPEYLKQHSHDLHLHLLINSNTHRTDLRFT